MNAALGVFGQQGEKVAIFQAAIIIDHDQVHRPGSHVLKWFRSHAPSSHKQDTVRVVFPVQPLELHIQFKASLMRRGRGTSW